MRDPSSKPEITMIRVQRASRVELFHRKAKGIERRLRALPFCDLDAVLSSEGTASVYSSRVLGSQIIPIAERPDSDSIQVVVQGFLPCRLCLGSHVHVSGFRRYRDGRLEEMTDGELVAYD